MAIEAAWGAGTIGEAAQHGAYEPRNKVKDTFKPIQPKQVTPAEREQHVQNVVNSVQSATPSERRNGAQWYARAHRTAVTLAAGANPAAPGRTRRTAMKDFAHKPPVEQHEAVNRAAGVMARLSPSGGGMTYERSIGAVHDLGKMTDRSIGQVNRGQRQSLTGSNLRFASNRDIVSAHAVLHGDAKPEDVLPMKLKTGHFYKNISEPGKHGATIDARSHDIALGERHGWHTNRGLQSAGRYKHFEDVHGEAANRLGMTPDAVQATSWVADKRKALNAGQGKNTAISQRGQAPRTRSGKIV